MNARIAVLICALLPTAALAAPKVSLLAGQTLRVAPAFGLLAQADLPPQAGQPMPPPPPPPGSYEAPPPSAQPPANLVPDEEPPSLGAVLGFMITGGVVGVTGIGFVISGLLYLALASVSTSIGPTGTQDLRTGYNIAGIVLICLGLAMDGVAVFLLLHGNSLRVKRAAYNEQHGITDGTDSPPRAPSASWQPGLAWSF